MRRVTLRRLAWVVPFALLAAACDNETTTTPTTPTTPTTTVSITDVFTGSISQTGSALHTFATEPGRVTTTLTSLAPVTTSAIGIEVGTWDGASCIPVLATASALVSDQNRQHDDHPLRQGL